MSARWHRLSLRLAWRVSGITALTLAVVALAGYRLPFWVICAISALVGAAVYLMIRHTVAARVARTTGTLEAIDQGNFDKFDTELSAVRDELDALQQKSLRTGVSVAAEIRERERIEHYRREFLGDVSHELKTPIFSIRGFAETLLNGALDDEKVRRDFTEKIQRNAERLSNLAEDLGEVARIEMGELSMNLESFSLRRLAREVVDTFEPLAVSQFVTVRQTIADDLPLVRADRGSINQVLSNLIDNAIKYSRAGGHVEVVARLLPNGRVKVSVVDNGIGIAPEHIHRLTERFFRVDTSRSRSLGGTGLGLAIVKHLLGAHDSQLLVESKPEVGSTFGFTLPTATDTPQMLRE